MPKPTQTAKKHFLFLWLFLFSIACFCQDKNSPIPALDSLKKLHASGKLNDTAYMNQFVKINNHKNYFNVVFKQHMDYFEKIAFSKDEYGSSRGEYYVMMANFADLHDYQQGSRIFFLEKAEEAFKKAGNYPILGSMTVELGRFYNWAEAKKGIEKGKSVMGFIDSLPGLIPSQKVLIFTVKNALHILKYMQSFDYLLNDTIAANGRMATAEKIVNAAVKTTGLYVAGDLSLIHSTYFFMQYQKDMYLQNTTAIEADLKKIIQHCIAAKASGFPWGNLHLKFSYMYLVQHFFETKQLDSAAAYLAIYSIEKGNSDKNTQLGFDDVFYIKSYAKLQYLKGNYKEAYDELLKGYEVSDSAINARQADINNNLYAQTQAEYNRKQLLKEEKNKQYRNVIILLAILSVICGVAVLYGFMHKKEVVAKKRIENLTAVSKKQIAELEEKNYVAKQEEQQRLGMELHDSLAGSLAAIKIKLDIAATETAGTEAAKSFEAIKNMAEAAYQSTRKLSHEWFNNNQITTEISFAKRIETILENGLPPKYYETEILIDDNCLDDISLEQKIQIISIIQEAVNNILKHAKANKVAVLMYEEGTNVILQITDNGTGFDEQKINKGIGLSSMKERVHNIGGKLLITSGKRGTEITVVIKSQHLV